MIYEPKAHKIVKIQKYTDEVWLFRVKTDINPWPGQFFQVSVLGVGECPLASCSYEKKYVDMLVRKAGNVTNAIFKLKAGDEVYLRGPYGHGYKVDEIKGKNLILVAGGTGVAPVTSLIDYIDKNRDLFGKISIYFAFRDDEHVFLGDRIKKWGKKYDINLCLDKESKKLKAEIGHVPDIMVKKKQNTNNSVALLCGPEGMMNATSNKLNGLGLSNDRIYWNMERRMECGIGNCNRCLIHDVYVCSDGPVFRYDLIKEKIEHEAN